MNILFIGPTRIGDAVLSSGLVQYLYETYPHAQITIACGVVAAPLYAGVPHLVRLIPIVKKPASSHWLEVWRAVVGVRWDMVIDLRRSVIPWTVFARRRFISGPPESADEHRVVSLARTLGLADNPPDPCLWTRPLDDQRAAELIPDGGPVLAIAPTANWRGKTWRSERFAQLIGHLTGEETGDAAIFADARVAVFCGPGEEEAATAVLDSLPADRRIDLVAGENLPAVGACLKRCAMFIGNDSGLMHMAAAAGVPTVGLFGPSRTEHYRPWGECAVAVRTEKQYDELVGGPGYDHRTTDTLMDSLSVDAVVKAAVELWRTQQQMAAQ